MRAHLSLILSLAAALHACKDGGDATDDSVDCQPTEEVCDGVDNDCDGLVDDDDSLIGATEWFPDDDRDGHGDAAIPEGAHSCAPLDGHVANNDDCNDTDPDNFPGNAEICDGQDNDCDALLDADDPDAVDLPIWYLDDDRDGYGDGAVVVRACTAPPGYVDDDSDCDDSDSRSYPDATERCDAADNDCDGQTDEGGTCSGACTRIAREGDELRPYLFCVDNSVWQAARTSCQGRGYDLVVVDDEAENDWLQQNVTIVDDRPWWIGYSDATTEGTWEWVDGSDGGFEGWFEGFPGVGVYGDPRDCAGLLGVPYGSDSTHPGNTWTDERCNTGPFYYICEIPSP